MRAAALLVVFLSACASLSESECRSTNWFQLGMRDADVYGMRPMIDQYAHRCRAFGVTPDQTAYMAGWYDGELEYRRRTTNGQGVDGI